MPKRGWVNLTRLRVRTRPKEGKGLKAVAKQNDFSTTRCFKRGLEYLPANAHIPEHEIKRGHLIHAVRCSCILDFDRDKSEAIAGWAIVVHHPAM